MSADIQDWLAAHNAAWAYELGRATVAALLVAFVFIPLTALVLIYIERKISGYIQDRYGPMRWGPKGVLQTIYDALKLVQKEDIVPSDADRVLFTAAPILVVVPAVVVFVTMPFGRLPDGRPLMAADLNLGVVFMFAFGSVTVLGIMTAGWASNNKWSLLGGIRSAAQMVSYEIPMGLAIITIILPTGSMRMSDIIAAQAEHWNLWRFNVVGVLAFLLYLTAAIAETNRGPFDIPEAESELVAGFHTEYTGMKFAFFFLTEFANMFVVCAIATTLFLGGYEFPFAGLIEAHWPSVGAFVRSTPATIVWFFGKVFGLIVLMMWIRWTYPRLRVDQLMNFSWKLLIPVGFGLLILMGLLVLAR
ncbi:MAG: NADH-quinone oxidoreductase subunit NuoH [Armatimonadota bacterium]